MKVRMCSGNWEYIIGEVPTKIVGNLFGQISQSLRAFLWHLNMKLETIISFSHWKYMKLIGLLVQGSKLSGRTSVLMSFHWTCFLISVLALLHFLLQYERNSKRKWEIVISDLEIYCVVDFVNFAKLSW